MENSTTERAAFESVAAIREANAAIGHYFFNPETLRLFRSRISEDVYGGRYFVTSERDEAVSSRFPAAWNGERRYTVREASPDGSVSTVGSFGAYGTLAEAKRAAKALARADA